MKNFGMTNEYLTVYTKYIRVNFHRDNDIVEIIVRETGETMDVPYAKVKTFDDLLLKVQAAVVEMCDDIDTLAFGKEMCDVLTECRDNITSFVNGLVIAYIDIPNTIRVQHKELKLVHLCPRYKHGELGNWEVDICAGCEYVNDHDHCCTVYDDWVQFESDHTITSRGIWNRYTDGSTRYTKFWLLIDDKKWFQNELGTDIVDFDEIISDMMCLDENTVIKFDGIDGLTGNTVEWLSLYLKDRVKVLHW